MWEGPWCPDFRGAKAAPTSNLASHDGQVAFDVVESGDAWEQSPFFESELLKQPQARFVVGEDQTNHRVDLNGGRANDRCERKDGDGYWVYLANGWMCDEGECHTIHEDTISECARRMKGVQPCTLPNCCGH